MAFTLLIAMAAGVLFGLAPAFQVRSHRLHDALVASGRGLVAGSQQRARQALVVGEIALSLMLLIGATLLIQSFARMQRVDVGFRSAAVLTIDRIELPPGRAAAASSAAFFESLVRALRNVPGVEAAAVTLGPASRSSRKLFRRRKHVLDSRSGAGSCGRAALRPAARRRAATTSPSLAYRSRAGVGSRSVTGRTHRVSSSSTKRWPALLAE
jgi:hypothetical protein